MLLEDHKTFETVADLNAAIYAHLCNHWTDLTNTERNSLKILARYAVKYPGAAHLKAATLGGLIGKSEKTARRVLNKLQQLGIVRKITTIRPKSKGTGANIIQIQKPSMQPAAQPDPHDVQPQGDNMSKRSEAGSKCQASSDGTSAQEESSTYKTSLSNYNRHGKQSDPDENAALKNSIPADLYAAMNPYFCAKEMYKTIGILWRSKASAGGSDILVEDYAQDYANSFRYAVLMFKQRKISNLEGYLYRAWQNVTSWIKRKMGVANNPHFYDWLEM